MNQIEIELPVFRKKLHEFPDLSGQEKKTSLVLKKTLLHYKPDEIISELGGYGLAVLFDSKKPGPAIMIRAELDALPIQEINEFSYKSKNPGISHSCGHDGHMTILIGLASWLQKEKKNLQGKVILLFQPAEENAAGAKLILNDPKFKPIQPEYIFALHNIPGYNKGSVIVKKGVFASASQGLIIKLVGKTSHAAHPDKGKNPVLAMTAIIEELSKIPTITTSEQNNALITIIHVKLGEIAFGTSPGDAVIMATFRAQHNEVMQRISEEAENLVKKIAEAYQLEYTIKWVEQFPALQNDDECVDTIRSASKILNKEIVTINEPFLWSEDFSFFTQEHKGAMFGIGSGVHHPQLHNPDYDFPDDIIDVGVCLFQEIIRKIVKK
jgi:amidohydrolase